MRHEDLIAGQSQRGQDQAMMRTSVASNGEIVVPGELAEKLGFLPGDSLEATIEAERLFCFPH